MPAPKHPPSLPPAPQRQELLLAAASPHPGLPAAAAANSLVFAAGMPVLLRGLTWEGVANSWLLGTATYAAFGAGGYLLVCLYFIFGTLVRSVPPAGPRGPAPCARRASATGRAPRTARPLAACDRFDLNWFLPRKRRSPRSNWSRSKRRASQRRALGGAARCGTAVGLGRGG